MTKSTVTIYHNPNCSKSRKTLALLEEKNIIPNIVSYLDTPPDAAEINKLLSLLGLSPRDLIRNSEQAYKDLNLQDTSLSDKALIEAMVSAPILIQRPIVIYKEQARIGRPPESVLEILD